MSGDVQNFDMPTLGTPATRAHQQFRFVAEMDTLKSVVRHSQLIDGSRRENSAEHSWHVALMAIVLAEYADEPIDIGRVLRMLLIHDVVEIDAGDAYLYDVTISPAEIQRREENAADRLFGLLPVEQAEEFRSLWTEFESRSTADARFARAIDRLHPLLLNYIGGGVTWRRNRITSTQVMDGQAPLKDASQRLWSFAASFIKDAVARNILEQ